MPFPCVSSRSAADFGDTILIPHTVCKSAGETHVRTVTRGPASASAPSRLQGLPHLHAELNAID